jgi:hypothetical protein
VYSERPIGGDEEWQKGSTVGNEIFIGEKERREREQGD